MESPSEALCISLSSFCRLRLRWVSWWWAASEWQRVCCCLGRRACCCARASLWVPQEMFGAENTTPAGRRCTKTCQSAFPCFQSFISPPSFPPPASVKDSFISTLMTKEPILGKCRRWLYDDIKEAFFMRFLLEVIIQMPTTVRIYDQVILYAFKAPVPFSIRTTPSKYSWKTAIQPSWCSWTEIMSPHIKGTTFTQNTSYIFVFFSSDFL